MRKRTLIFLAAAWLLAAVGVFSPQIGWADLDWRIIKELDLKTPPLDVAPSADGQRLFILTPGQILIYSVQEGKITDQIPVGKEFDRITSSPRADVLSLTSSTKKTLQMIVFETVYKIDVTGLPYKGNPNAFVTIAVFTDYQ